MSEKAQTNSYRQREQIHLSIPVPNLNIVRKIADKKGISIQSYLNTVISEIAEKHEPVK